MRSQRAEMLTLANRSFNWSRLYPQLRRLVLGEFVGREFAALNVVALISVKCFHFSGRSSSAKSAHAGQSGTQAPQVGALDGTTTDAVPATGMAGLSGASHP